MVVLMEIKLVTGVKNKINSKKLPHFFGEIENKILENAGIVQKAMMEDDVSLKGKEEVSKNTE